MGRPERPVDPTDGPVAAFAHDLRELRQAAGRPTYSAMARRAHRSASVLAEAAGGTTLPTLDTTLAYVAVCGGDAQEWTARWEAVRATLGPADDVDGAAGRAVPADDAAPAVAGGVRDGRRGPWPAVAAVAVLALVVGGVAVWLQGRGADDVRPAAAAASTPSDPTPEDTLVLDRPAAGGKVAMLDDVVIRRSGTAVGRHVWILVQFVGGPVTNPQGDCSTQDGVEYLCAKAQFGDPDTTPGTQFQITAVEVDEEGHLAMQSLVAAGFNPATMPVPYLAESEPIVVSRR